MSEQHVEFVSTRSSGPATLEGRLHAPDGAAGAPGVVVCHPHPAGGGEMGVPLIRYLAEELGARGLFALRFNFAGVGMSEGTFTDGAEEPADVRAAHDFLVSEAGCEPGATSVVGWSFGAWMALLAVAGGLPARACVAIAPPLSACRWEQETARLASSPAKRLYIIGDRDQFCAMETIRSFVSAVSPGDLDPLAFLPETDHFLFGMEQEVVRMAADFLAE